MMISSASFTSRRELLRYGSTVIAASLGGCASSGTRTSVQDWPTFGRDAGNTAYNPQAIGPSSAERDWHAKTNGSPIVLAGNLYHVQATKRDALLIVRSPTTGERRTRISLPLPGTTAPPTVTDDLAYVTGPTGVVAVDLQDQSVRWHKNKSDGITDVHGAATVVDGVVYVCSGDFGSGTPAVHALESASGTRRWRHRLFDDARSTPAVAEGTVFATTTGGAVFAIDADDGSLRWKFYADDGIHLSPVVAENTVYVRDVGGTLYSLRTANGDERWRYVDDTLTGDALAVARETVYSGDSIGIKAIDASDGTEKWTFSTPGGNGGSNAMAVANGTLFVGGEIGHVFSLDTATGEENWRFQTGFEREADQVRRTVLGMAVADDTLYVGAADGLYAFRDGT